MIKNCKSDKILFMGRWVPKKQGVIMIINSLSTDITDLITMSFLNKLKPDSSHDVYAEVGAPINFDGKHYYLGKISIGTQANVDMIRNENTVATIHVHPECGDYIEFSDEDIEEAIKNHEGFTCIVGEYKYVLCQLIDTHHPAFEKIADSGYKDIDFFYSNEYKILTKKAFGWKLSQENDKLD